MSTGAREVWIDERQRALPARPWRKIHLDFQMDAAVGEVGARFDPDAFAATLQAAHVDAVVLCAKNTYGYAFFPSEAGPVHPGLVAPNLVGRQAAAARAAGIKAYAYLSIGWDEYAAERHPEWLAFKRDRTSYLPQLGESPMWSALCMSHPAVAERAMAQTSELLRHAEVDGVWFDMVYPIAGECFCWRCLEQLRDAGLDPLDEAVQRQHKSELHASLLRRLAAHVRGIDPALQVEYNTLAVLGVGDRLDAVDNIDIEALPTGGWGYGYFPLHARYARTLGRSVYGMSGRFHTAWGDYGGLKHPTQLRTELAGIVGQAVRCDIGDQPLPTAGLDAATYATIGEAYAEIERLEPWLEGAVPATEAAIVVDGPPLAHLADLGGTEFPAAHAAAIGGLAKLMAECQLQFDVVDVAQAFERYRLVVLPDSLEVDEALAARLTAYLADGGAVIASHRALRASGTDELWPAALRGAYRGASPFQPAFTRLDGDFATELPRYADYDFALYGEADRWEVAAADDVVVLGRLGEARFQRWQEGWQSAPPQDRTRFATIVQAGGLGAFCFPIGASYFDHSYWIYRELFRRMVARLLPQQLVQVSAPQSAEVTVTHQAATAQRGERWIVHVVNYSPLRRGRGGIEYVEDPIPLHDVGIALAIDGPIERVYDARTDAALALSYEAGRWYARVARVPIAATVVFEAPRQ
ncbi:alpha-amylase family protein [Conexibacter stalactiti]|uniref:Beta-galactosidase trimerization domain-containing protein n=1 Tax=Conexibacter stalactiti TaxID=1940611 RepID=A0ABU4HLB5_9ACTN|nr:alpha-amylase family protein [Conexibacter stalactiti]MDW5594083.1 beta-galactosidase trimerization domain-containing protein [Conexibacter stalactiti]MEC5034725.1 alpha-amylase family protein [Conexibacter stalactiti]